MNVSLRQLRAAVAVAKHLNFSRAAAEVHVSQPALSTTIADLEDTLGMTLFDRTSRSVVPTEPGAAFLQGAARILDDIDRLLLNTKSQVESRRGHVVVSTVSSIAGRLMSRVVLACAQRYPAIELEVRDDVATQVLQSVRSGEADFALTVEPDVLDNEVLFEPCLVDPIFVVCHRSHRIARQSTATWKDLTNERLVALSTTSGVYRIVQQELLRQRVNFSRSTRVSHLSTVHGMLEAGFGVSILPSIALPVNDHPLLLSIPLTKPALSRTIGIYRNRDRSPTPAAQGVMEVIDAVINSWPGPAHRPERKSRNLNRSARS